MPRIRKNLQNCIKETFQWTVSYRFILVYIMKYKVFFSVSAKQRNSEEYLSIQWITEHIETHYLTKCLPTVDLNMLFLVFRFKMLC